MVLNTGSTISGQNQEVGDACAHLPAMNGMAYLVGTNTPASGYTTPGSTFIANTASLSSGRLYLLPAVYSPVSLTCQVAPFTPSAAQCAAQSTDSRVMCRDK